MIAPDDLQRGVIIPVLRHLGLYSGAAEALLLGTFYEESTVGGNTHLYQLRGPARGGFQMEPVTHDDLWKTFLVHKPELSQKIGELLGAFPSPLEQLVSNLGYAAAMARVKYLRVKEPLPSASDYAGLARYWKTYYNTRAGAGIPARFEATLRKILG